MANIFISAKEEIEYIFKTTFLHCNDVLFSNLEKKENYKVAYINDMYFLVNFIEAFFKSHQNVWHQFRFEIPNYYYYNRVELIIKMFKEKAREYVFYYRGIWG